jgi:hypothetical protein
VIEFNLFPIRKVFFLGPSDKLFQQTVISALGVGGLAAFVPEVLQEIVNEVLHFCSES